MVFTVAVPQVNIPAAWVTVPSRLRLDSIAFELKVTREPEATEKTPKHVTGPENAALTFAPIEQTLPQVNAPRHVKLAPGCTVRLLQVSDWHTTVAPALITRLLQASAWLKVQFAFGLTVRLFPCAQLLLILKVPLISTDIGVNRKVPDAKSMWPPTGRLIAVATVTVPPAFTVTSPGIVADATVRN